MKKDSIVLNEEREMFLLTLLGLFPIVPIILFIFTLIFWFLLLAIVWFVSFIMIYLYFYSRLMVYDEKIKIKTFSKIYEISFDDIAYIYSKRNFNYVNYVTYTIELKYHENVPKRYLTIKNKKFQKLVENKIIKLPIKSTIIL